MAEFNDKGAFADPADSQLVAEAKRDIPDPLEYTYTERDVILYNLGIGATAKELQWTYENHEEFAALPTFGVIPQFQASMGSSLEWLPNYNPVSLYSTCNDVLLNSSSVQAKLLHGEQYLSIKGDIPTSGSVVNETRLVPICANGQLGCPTERR